jgi:hypothetical protein
VVSMPQQRASQLLELWERAVVVRPWERGDVLLGATGVTPATLSERNAALLTLRSQLFGRAQPLRCSCAVCGATVEFAVDCDVLAGELVMANDAGALQCLSVDGFLVEFRVPAAADVRIAAARAGERVAFVRELLHRCVIACTGANGEPCSADDLPDSAGLVLSKRLEELEPGAVVCFALTCPECGQHWHAVMDCADVLWSEIQSRAERLLLDVDALARSYGWSEAQVCALTPTRRAAYLQLVGAT